MGRPKGSTNKTMNPKVLEEIKAVSPEIVVEVAKEEVKNSPRGTFCKCGHEKKDHWGGPKAEFGGWCHQHGCECQNPVK